MLALGVGGTLLAVLAAVLAFWPRSGGRTGFRAAALILLVALYAVPAIVLDFEGEFLRGALLAVLVLAFLRLERLPVGDVPAAGVAAGVAAVAGAARRAAARRARAVVGLRALGGRHRRRAGRRLQLGPQLLAAGLAARRPRDDPRQGAARPRTGRRATSTSSTARSWRHDPRPRSQAVTADLPENAVSRRTWTQEMDVTIRNLESDTFITAGIATAVRGEPSYPLGGGIFAAPDGIGKGDTYTADVYTPRPSDRQMRQASTDYEDWLRFYRSVILPPPPDTETSRRRSSPGPASTTPAAPEAERFDQVPFDQALERAGLDRIWGLAQELKAGHGLAVRVHEGGRGAPRRRLLLLRDAAAGRAHARRLPLRRQDRLLPAVLRAPRRCCCGWAASRPAWPPASPPARSTRTSRSSSSATSTRTPGSRSGSPSTAGCSATRRRPWRRRAASRGTGAAASSRAASRARRTSAASASASSTRAARPRTTSATGRLLIARRRRARRGRGRRRLARVAPPQAPPAARAAADGGVRARAAPRPLRPGRGAHAHADGAPLRRLAGRGGLRARAARAALLGRGDRPRRRPTSAAGCAPRWRATRACCARGGRCRRGWSTRRNVGRRRRSARPDRPHSGLNVGREASRAGVRRSSASRC